MPSSRRSTTRLQIRRSSRTPSYTAPPNATGWMSSSVWRCGNRASNPASSARPFWPVPGMLMPTHPTMTRSFEHTIWHWSSGADRRLSEVARCRWKWNWAASCMCSLVRNHLIYSWTNVYMYRFFDLFVAMCNHMVSHDDTL